MNTSNASVWRLLTPKYEEVKVQKAEATIGVTLKCCSKRHWDESEPLYSQQPGCKNRKELSGENAHTGQKGCLDPLCLVYCPKACWGEKVHFGEQGHWPWLMDLISMAFWYAFAFHSHPTCTSTEAHLHSPPLPLPVVAFQCKWGDEWLQLAHQKASPAEGPWWLRFSQATPPLPSPTQHFVLTRLPPVPAYSLHPT